MSGDGWNYSNVNSDWSDKSDQEIQFDEETCVEDDKKQVTYILPERQHRQKYDDCDDDKYSKKKRKEKRSNFPIAVIFVIFFLLLGGLCLIWMLKTSRTDDFDKVHSHSKEKYHGDDFDNKNSRPFHWYKPKQDKKDDDDDIVDKKDTLYYDYVTVGQGIGGVATNYWLSEAMKKIGVPSNRVSIAAFEGEDDIGGNIHPIKLKKPSNYDGSFGKELYGDQGAQRTSQMTLGIKRRLIHQLGIEMLWSPFEGEYSTRGRRLNCGDPTQGAFSGGPYQVTPDPDGLLDMAFAYGSLCLSNEFFVGNTTTQFQKAFPNLHNVDFKTNESPTDDAYFWLLEGGRLEVAEDEPDLNTGNYDFVGFGSTNPVTGQQCDDPQGQNYIECPYELAKTNDLEWKTHVAKMFKFDSMATNQRATKDFNYDYAHYLEADNVGFIGDYREQYAAYSYGEWQLREWGSTNNIFGYLPGGEKRILTALANRSKHNGVDFYLGERVVKIEYSDKRDFEFRLETSKNRIVYVKKFLFMNTPPYHLFPEDENEEGTRWPGADLEGDVVKDLREVSEVQAPLAADVLRVLAQWEPGKRAWFWDLFDLKTGNKSYRQMGDEGCFSRTEFLDTPYHRCTNHIVPVYTDEVCERIWLSYLGEYERTGDSTKLKQRVVDEMKASFPELSEKIDMPILVNITHFKHAWHWIKRTHSRISNTDLIRKAAAPLGKHIPLALIGEAYGINWSGWQEGALRTSKRALLTRFNGALNTTLHEIFDELFKIFPELDGSVSDGSPLSNFAYIPPLFEAPDERFTLDTEKWWPYGPYDKFNQNNGDYCKAQRHGLKPFDE